MIKLDRTPIPAVELNFGRVLF